MRNGYHGKILHVDLTAGRTWVEELDDLLYRKYLGGSALASYFLLRDLRPGTDPLGPDNLLMFLTSVINGLPLSGINRYTAAGKSPLTGGFGESEAGGYWGPELKLAGFDGVIVHGRAPKPTYLFIHDGQCELRDASRYWGALADDVQEGLEQEIGDKRIRILQTGIAGENGVLYAAMCNQMRHFHGRAGLGAVMASKHLKAIAVRGKERINVANRDGTKAVTQWFRETYDHEHDQMHLYGTTRGVHTLHADGILPTHNFRDGSFDQYENMMGQKWTKEILVNRGTCFACAVACKREVEVPERGVFPKHGGMEYEVIAANGSLCGVGDIRAIADASTWINRYVLDGISTGVSIAWAMECYEKGIFTKDDTGGIELTWGNADAVLTLIHQIARREGTLGNLLADGVKRAAARVGKGSEQFALHVKGQELPMHEPRGKRSLTLAYAVSPTGADHMEAPHDPFYEGFGNYEHDFSQLGLLEPVDRMDLGARKVRTFYVLQTVWSLYNCVGMCDFVGTPIGDLAIHKLMDYVNAATGWDMSLYELMKVGERANTMARLFNQREGFTPKDDELPPRMFEPLQAGALQGKAIDRQEWADAMQLYYQMAGWDADGAPTRAKLAELGLDFALATDGH